MTKQEYTEYEQRVRDFMTRNDTEDTEFCSIGRTVGQLLASHNVHAGTDCKLTPTDYTLLDTVMGHRVKRVSQVSLKERERTHGYLGWIIRQYTNSWRYGNKADACESEDMTPTNYITSFLEAKGEVEYLTEMVRLSTERKAVAA